MRDGDEEGHRELEDTALPGAGKPGTGVAVRSNEDDYHRFGP